MNDRSCRVLLIEDDPNDVCLLKRALDKGRIAFEISSATTLAEGLDAVRTGSWDVVLSDLSLPDAQGFDAVQRLRSIAPICPSSC